MGTKLTRFYLQDYCAIYNIILDEQFFLNDNFWNLEFRFIVFTKAIAK